MWIIVIASDIWFFCTYKIHILYNKMKMCAKNIIFQDCIFNNTWMRTFCTPVRANLLRSISSNVRWGFLSINSTINRKPYCSPVLQLWDITLQSKVKLLSLGEELPEQQHVGVGCVDELHLHLPAHHRLQPVQHLLYFVHCEGFLHQPSERNVHTRITDSSELKSTSLLSYPVDFPSIEYEF